MGGVMKAFKNDKERIAFLEDYTNRENGWYLFRNDIQMQRRAWALDLLDGTTFIVEEEMRTITWPETHQEWLTIAWFIIDQNDRKPYGDCRGSRTMALAILKEVEKSDKRRSSQDPAQDPGTGSMGAAD